MPALNVYCASCGHPNSYTTEKQNFCQKCGEDFRSPSNTGTPHPVGHQRSVASLALEEQEEVSKVPDLQGGLQVETQVYKAGPIKLGDLAGTADESTSPQRPHAPQPKGRKPSKKKVMEDFKKEAGAIKPNG